MLKQRREQEEKTKSVLFNNTPSEVVIVANHEKSVKAMLMYLLKNHMVAIEYDEFNRVGCRKLVIGTYKGYTLLKKLPNNVIYIRDAYTEKELQIDIAQIRIVRIFD